MNSKDYEKAAVNPAEAFASPEELVARPDLSRSEKVDLLRRWHDDACELSVAEEEGMGGGEPSLLERVSAALASLEKAPPRG